MDRLKKPASPPKVYIEIVGKLREMIEEDGLEPGDKIPSERELSERLNVGRSSVREALRALELLGLIETRRGEGTFIRDFQEHRLVELLGTFFLQDEKVIKDLAETKTIIELDCLRLIASSAADQEIKDFKEWAGSTQFTDEMFFEHAARINPNRLMERIWRVVNSYAGCPADGRFIREKAEYLELIDSLFSRDMEKTLVVYSQKVRKLSNGE
ncbi:FadR family transcriptional regulator [Peribacillus saganii]|uniref:FadR family transcriptional regulator n=1 Tax=Peribacillus saganii TaxID=2303992 RepID=A0A372LR88_9BACI|nr:GntR family transcriptional regulator [Peribacillus saganii]RFU70743.1 FadR family transcriptional regulator [Peribacillus saganii]